jgi:hypothetical protein
MMAKNPKDRFQRPIHLVHHLMKIAQKVGAANDLPEGVLVVDAPIVAEPRGRPLLLIGLSLVILVAVVMLVGILSDPAPYGVPQPISRITDSKDVGVKRDDKKDSAKTTVPHTSPVRAVHNREDWHKFLSDASRSVNAKMEAEPIALDGTSIQAAKDQFLTLESDRADENTLQFLYTNAVPVGLVIESGEEITFRRIRFQIDSDGAPLQSAAAVAIRGGKTIRFEQCIFAQAKVPRVAAQRTPLASILIDAPTLPDGARPTVYLDRCYFDSNNPPGGQIAVAINGPAKVIATNCAFRPHAAYFSFRDKCTLDSTEVTAENCVGFVETGPVFRLSKNASAQIRARHNVFSRPGLGLGSAEQPGLIYRAGSLPFRYEGKANIYHHLNALVEKRLSLEKSSDIIGTPEAFQSELAQWQGTDANSTHIPLNDPSSPFLASAAGADQDLAFQLKPEHQRAGLGLQKTWLNSEWPDAVAAKNPPPMPRKKIVDADDDTPGIYKNVLEALAAAKHGDVIWIKHGEDPYVEVPPIELKPGVSVTLKPYDETFHPILVLDKAFRNKDSALFKVRNGALNIEHMEIRLDPVQEDFVTQSMIHMGESAQLSFTNCVLTLRGPEKVQLNVATFIDLDLMPKMEAASSGSARVEFRDCFVRGKGDLVALRGCRRLHVEVKNSLIALQGSLLDIEAASRAMAMGDGVTWRMERSSIIAGDSLFAFRINAGKVLTETKADVEDCLLATFSNGTPAAQHIIDGIRSEELGKVFSWRGRHNYFANFEMQDVREWKDRDADGKSEIGTLSFPKFEDKTYLQRLWDATPDWFRPAAVEQERISGFGVPPDIEKRLLPPDTEE